MTDRLQEIQKRWEGYPGSGGMDGIEYTAILDCQTLLHLLDAETKRREAAEALLDTALECAGYEVLVDGSRAPIVGDEPMYSLWEAWQQAIAEAEKEAK